MQQVALNILEPKEAIDVKKEFEEYREKMEHFAINILEPKEAVKM